QFSEKLDKGKFNIMLYGLSRVKILKFVQNKPYRIARVKILRDANFDYDGFDEQFEAERFLRSVRKYLSEMGVEKVNEFLRLNLHSYSFESIVNQVATVLDFMIHEKQTLLEMDSIELRYDKLKSLLQDKLITLKIAKNVKYVPENPIWN
ncbi:MAG: LON peptidase substrate-binding domain-containing protein, partial [bacterium]